MLVRVFGAPDIFNTDQGSQFSSEDWTTPLKNAGVSISMDGKGRWIDNVFIERLWRSVKYEDVYLHAPEKTRLLEFGRFAVQNRARRGLGKPETFNFLGFTHIAGRSLDGRFQLKRKTRRDRMRAKLQSLKRELRRRMHEPIPLQGRWLGQVVRGYFEYHSVPTNTRSLSAFRDHVKKIWRRVLYRRSQTDCTSRKRITQLADAFLPTPRVLHPWPDARFLVNHPRWEPSAVNRARSVLCGGGRPAMGVPTAILLFPSASV